MHYIPIGIIVLAFALLVALKLIVARKDNDSEEDIYFLKDSLFSPAERSFFGVLESLCDENTTIQSKVRLADIFGLKKGLGRALWQRSFNRISSKHVDFLLLRKADAQPLLGIELDDSSHDEGERVARDKFVDSVFSSAKLPILHFKVRQNYDQKEIFHRIEEALAERS